MELRHLRSFVVVAAELNFRRAAEKLHVAQSPLSQQIRQLERDVGTALFLRSTRKVELTDAGKAFLVEAHELLARASNASVRAIQAAAGKSGRLRIGYLTSLTNDRLAGALRKFRAEYPDVDLALNDLVPEQILQGLRHRELDVGFFRAALRDEELTAQEIWRDRLMAALPRRHWLVGKGAIGMRDLAKETFIMVPDAGSMGLNETIRNACLKAGFAPERRLEANQMQAAIWLVHVGLGVAIVPESLQAVQRDNVVYQPIRQAPTLGAFMVWRKDNRSEALERFTSLIRQAV